MAATTIYNATITINNQNIPVTSFNFEYTRDMELVHVNDVAPVGKTKGKRSFSGNVTLLAEDAFKIEAAAPKVGGEQYADELNFDIVHTQNFGFPIGIVTKIYKNCSITKFDISAGSEDKNMQVQLPLLFTGIVTI